MRNRMSILWQCERWYLDKPLSSHVDKDLLQQIIDCALLKLSNDNRKLRFDMENEKITAKSLKSIFGTDFELRYHLIVETVVAMLIKIGVFEKKGPFSRLRLACDLSVLNYRRELDAIPNDDILINCDMSYNFRRVVMWKNHIYFVSDLKDIDFLKLREVGKKLCDDFTKEVNAKIF